MASHPMAAVLAQRRSGAAARPCGSHGRARCSRPSHVVAGAVAARRSRPSPRPCSSRHGEHDACRHPDGARNRQRRCGDHRRHRRRHPGDQCRRLRDLNLRGAAGAGQQRVRRRRHRRRRRVVRPIAGRRHPALPRSRHGHLDRCQRSRQPGRQRADSRRLARRRPVGGRHHLVPDRPPRGPPAGGRSRHRHALDHHRRHRRRRRPLAQHPGVAGAGRRGRAGADLGHGPRVAVQPWARCC